MIVAIVCFVYRPIARHCFFFCLYFFFVCFSINLCTLIPYLVNKDVRLACAMWASALLCTMRNYRRQRFRGLLRCHVELATYRSASLVTVCGDVCQTHESLVVSSPNLAHLRTVYFALYKCTHYYYYYYYTYIHTYIHTYIRVFCIAHINSIESLCA